jgi:hypothetical protein
MIRSTFFFVVALLLVVHEAHAQGDFYEVGSIQQIEIFFADDNWDYQLDTAKLGADEFALADSVRINGVNYVWPGIKYKGNSSYDSTFAKNPMHISLDEFIEQDYQGHSSIKLSNGYADPSMVREVLAYEIVRNYMIAPGSNFARVYVNGSYLGIYSNDQHVGNNFCEEQFLSPNGVLIKGNPAVMPGPTVKSNLRYIDADSSSYMNYYEVKSDWGWNALVDLCEAISNSTVAIEQVVDVDRMLWMLAFNNVMVNLDSYSGVFAQNYYIYQDTTGRFNPVVWDLNMCFGGFPFLGSGNSSMGSLTITNMQQLPTVIHATDTYWPLIRSLMSDPLYRRIYMAHVRTIAHEMIATSFYETRTAELQAIIASAVSEDENKFFTDTDFDNALYAPVNIGNYNVPGIYELMDARMEFLMQDGEFMLQAPEYEFVSSTSDAPSLGETFTIRAALSGATNVWLGRRQTSAAKFVRVPMYDDGVHDDGAVGDGVFGAFVTMQSDSLQYYIYADNTEAGAFSPARAEHEFHVLYSQALSVHEKIASQPVFLFPNPARDYVMLSARAERESYFRMFNMKGEVVLERTISPNSIPFNNRIDIGSLSSGLYMAVWDSSTQLIQVIK